MHPSDVDQTILTVAQDYWLKVARVIIDVADVHRFSLHDEPRLESIAQRIRVFVADGRLEAQGDLNRWRYSEVRKPSAHV